MAGLQTHHVTQEAEWLDTLRGCYAAEGVPLPFMTVMEESDVPQPYQRLLVHQRDMTSVLEGYHGGTLELRLLRAETEDSVFTRQVALVLTSTRQAVEFGAIRIHLDRFAPEPRRMILDCRRPLGAILRQHSIAYLSRPNVFFRVRSDAIIGPALELTGEPQLFGRYNILYDATARPLAEVVEILPPTGTRTPSEGE